MKKKLHILPLLFCCMAAVISCSKDDTQDGGGQDSLSVNVIRSEYYTPNRFLSNVMPDELFKSLSLPIPDFHPAVELVARQKVLQRIPKMNDTFRREVGLDYIGDRLWIIESHVFSYKSIAADGTEITLSGRVSYPNNTVDNIDHEVSSMTLFSHASLLTEYWEPYSSLSLVSTRTFQNSAVIEPDFQGLGIDAGNNIHPEAATNVLARQMADCVVAALKVMSKNGVRLADDGCSYNLGGSLSSKVALMFHKYFETEASPEFRKAVRLNSSFVGTGIEHHPTMMRNMINNDNHTGSLADVTYQQIIPTLAALSENQLEGYKLSDFLSDKVMTKTIVRGDNEITLYDFFCEKDPYLEKTKTIKSQAILDLSNIDLMASDMLTPDNIPDPESPKNKALIRIINRLGNYLDYSPSLPIYMCQNINDEFFSEGHFRAIYDNLSDKGQNPNVHKGNIPTPYPVAAVGKAFEIMPVAHYYGYIMTLLEFASTEQPDDMFNDFNKQQE